MANKKLKEYNVYVEAKGCYIFSVMAESLDQALLLGRGAVNQHTFPSLCEKRELECIDETTEVTGAFKV